MNRSILFVGIGVGLLLSTGTELLARGGGGGGRGGGGGGGMARPAPSAGRSPAMSAPRPSSPSVSRPSPGTGAAGGARPPVSGIGSAPRPATGNVGGARPASGATRPGGVGATPGSRPSANQLNNFLDVPRASTGAVGAAGTRQGGAAADFLQQGARPGQSPVGAVAGTRPVTGAAGVGRPGAAAAVAGLPGVGRAGAAGERRQNLSENRAGRVENRQELQQNRSSRVNEIRDQVTNDTPLRDFWSDHPVWGAWAITRPFRWANWGAMSGWVGYGATEPAYYNYGENVYYQDDAVYSGDQQIATAEEYAQQAETIVQSAPDTPPKDTEWMPLGVFACTQDGQATGAAPTLFMQLVISKQGVIAGTFNNQTTGETQTLEGMIDKATQRAAWGVQGKQRPIVECGLSNLTQDSAPVLVHFDGGQTQQWLLVRLEEPPAKN